MITTLRVERFKSIRRLSLVCRRVNVFIGQPDTGKTNILEALHFMSRLGWNLPLGAELRLTPELGFDTLFYRQFFDAPFRIEVEIDPPRDGVAKVTLEAKVGGSDRRLRVEIPELRLAVHLSFNTCADVRDLQWLRFYSFTTSRDWSYEVGANQRGEKIIIPTGGQNLTYIARHNERAYEFLKDLVSGIKWKLRFDQHLKTFRLSEVRQEEILDYNIDVLSDSVKRLFFYGAILRTSEDATLVFDEPDVFAFPPYPKTLGDLIAVDSANQYFLTTHNPYFLSSLVEKTPADAIAVFVCSRDEEGATVAHRVSPQGMVRIVEDGASAFFNLDDLVAP